MAAKAKSNTWVFMHRSFTLPIDEVSSRTLPPGLGFFVTKAEAKLIEAAGAGEIRTPPADAIAEEAGALEAALAAAEAAETAKTAAEARAAAAEKALAEADERGAALAQSLADARKRAEEAETRADAAEKALAAAKDAGKGGKA